jgi:hypothetical protein
MLRAEGQFDPVAEECFSIGPKRLVDFEQGCCGFELVDGATVRSLCLDVVSAAGYIDTIVKVIKHVFENGEAELGRQAC